MSDPEVVRAAIKAVRTAAQNLGEAKAHEQLLEDGRSLEKSAAIRRLMGTENPETGKPHSASSAEKVVEQDEQYKKYRQIQANAVISSQIAWGDYEVAKLNAALEIALVEVNTVRIGAA